MKRLFAVLLLSALAVRADIEFSGFFITSKEALFSLTDTETQQSSGWLKIGQSFGGYAVVSFDREQDSLILRQGEHLRTIRLRTSKVKDGRATISGSLKFMNEQVQGVHASLFFGEESSFPLSNGMIFRLKPERHSDGNIRYHAKFIAIDQNGTEKTLAAPSVVALPGQPFGIQVGDFGYSFTP